MVVVAIVLITIFLFLSVIHVYWAFGGTRFAANAVPEVEGKPIFQPGQTATLFVAAGLAALAVLVAVLAWPSFLLNADYFVYAVYAGWAACFIFAARAIGDFKYVGFFKRITDTDFAKLDTKYYTPLCVVLSGLLGILVYNA